MNNSISCFYFFELLGKNEKHFVQEVFLIREMEVGDMIPFPDRDNSIFCFGKNELFGKKWHYFVKRTLHWNFLFSDIPDTDCWGSI